MPSWQPLGAVHRLVVCHGENSRRRSRREAPSLVRRSCQQRRNRRRRQARGLRGRRRDNLRPPVDHVDRSLSPKGDGSNRDQYLQPEKRAHNDVAGSELVDLLLVPLPESVEVVGEAVGDVQGGERRITFLYAF